jgi:CBS-domain-containing membrane protein
MTNGRSSLTAGQRPWRRHVLAGLGGASAIALMLETDTLHAPPGANPILVAIGGAGWSFLAMPILAGALLVAGTAFLFSRLAGGKPYPSRWW